MNRHNESLWSADFILSLLLLSLVLSLPIAGGYAIYSEHKATKENTFQNVQAQIVTINGNDVVEIGKMHTPTNVNTVLFKITDPRFQNQYLKLSSHDYPYGYFLTDEYIYNVKPGDNVVFKEMNQEQFFTIKER